MTIEKTIITLDRSKPFRLHPFLTTEYGEFSILSQNSLAEKITSFDLESDVLLKDFSGRKLISALELRNNVEKNGYIPLDIYCMEAIWKNRDLVKLMKKKWWQGIHTPRLETINFLGTILTTPGQRPEHVVTFWYDQTVFDHLNPQIMPYEASDQAWGEKDPVAVFNPRSKTILNQLSK